MNKNLISLVLLSFILVACAQDNTAPDNPTVNEEPIVETTDDERDGSNEVGNDYHDESSELVEKIDELPFNKFELDLDYADDVDFEVEFERNPSGNIDIEYLDEVNQIDEKDEAAFDLLYPKFVELELDQNLEDEEVINRVLDTFELREDYIEFELEIVFNDGTRREYKDKN